MPPLSMFKHQIYHTSLEVLNKSCTGTLNINPQLFSSSVTAERQHVSGTAACHRGAHQATSLRPHAGVQRIREEPHSSELEVLDCILLMKPPILAVCCLVITQSTMSALYF